MGASLLICRIRLTAGAARRPLTGEICFRHELTSLLFLKSVWSNASGEVCTGYFVLSHYVYWITHLLERGRKRRTIKGLAVVFKHFNLQRCSLWSERYLALASITAYFLSVESLRAKILHSRSMYIIYTAQKGERTGGECRAQNKYGYLICGSDNEKNIFRTIFRL